MIKRLVILIILLQTIDCGIVMAQQKRGNVWVTGRGTQIKFVNNTIVTQLNWPLGPWLPYFTSGNSNICDTNGNLILCSDGYDIYDSAGNYLDGGDTLVPPYHYIAKNGWSLYSQSSIFLPMDSNKYYFITPAFTDTQYMDCQANNHCYFDLLLYNVIDMNANGGAGKVVKRMAPLMENAQLRKTQMMACRHANGKDWWLLKQGGDSNTVYKFLFTQDSVHNMGYQEFIEPLWGIWDLFGQSTFSADGSKYASTCDASGIWTGKVFLADFDRCHGILSNPKVITMPKGSQYNPNAPSDSERLAKGVAYSPDNKLLYVIGQFNIWQFDFADSSWFHVAGMDTTFMQFQHYDAPYYGPDGKLYIGNFHGLSKQMSVISDPDVKGAGCNFCPRCLRLDTLGIFGAAGTPPCMPNYALGAQTCWALGTMQYTTDSMQLEVYPNPVSDQLKIENGEFKIKALYNSVGQLIFTTRKDEIDVRNLAPGVYYLKAGNQVKKVVIE